MAQLKTASKKRSSARSAATPSLSDTPSVKKEGKPKATSKAKEKKVTKASAVNSFSGTDAKSTSLALVPVPLHTKAASNKRTRSKRPQGLLKGLAANWKEEALQLASVGASDIEIRTALALTADRFDLLMKESVEFQSVLLECHDASQVWWEQQGRSNLHTKGFQTSLWHINMKNRFNWNEQYAKDQVPRDGAALPPTIETKIAERLREIDESIESESADQDQPEIERI